MDRWSQKPTDRHTDWLTDSCKKIEKNWNFKITLFTEMSEIAHAQTGTHASKFMYAFIVQAKLQYFHFLFCLFPIRRNVPKHGAHFALKYILLKQLG